MAEIQPFQGILYNTERVQPADVLTQPYDKITPEMQDKYLARSPYNLVQIELGKQQPNDTDTENKYSRAQALQEKWLNEGILRRSSKPSLYYLEQQFTLPNDSRIQTRKALIARVRLSRWDEGKVLPHELTLSKPKADRIALLRACGSQQGQIFMLHHTPKPTLSEILGTDLGNPVIDLIDDYKVRNVLYEISDPGRIERIQKALLDAPFYIADGHHRYETALAFRDECRTVTDPPDKNAPHEFLMATLVDANDPGLVVLPTHRVVSNLQNFDAAKFREQLSDQFQIKPQTSLDELLKSLKDSPDHSIGMADKSGIALLVPKAADKLKTIFQNKPPLWDTLDVALLHVAILENLLGIDEVRLREESNVSYCREAAKGFDLVQKGAAQLVFFLKPTKVSDVMSIADARSRMPQKSTDFYPKLLSGIVMYQVADRSTKSKQQLHASKP